MLGVIVYRKKWVTVVHLSKVVRSSVYLRGAFQGEGLYSRKNK